MRFSKADRAAYGHGLRTAQAGNPANVCPYHSSTTLGRSWLAGHAKGTPRFIPDPIDMAYEDDCAAGCGVGL